MAVGGAITSSGSIVGKGGQVVGTASSADSYRGGGGSGPRGSSGAQSQGNPLISVTDQQIQNLISAFGKPSPSTGNVSAPAVITSGPAASQYKGAATAIGGALSAYDANGLYNSERAKSAKAGLDSTLTYIDELMKRSDASAQRALSAIREEYATIAASQEQANKQYQGGVTAAGLASGRSRYAPEIQAGVQSAAVNFGLSKLAEIQSKKSKALSDAETAQMDRDFRLVTEKANVYNTLLKDERDVAAKVSKDYYDQKDEYRKTIDQTVRNVAPAILGSLTGDEGKDFKYVSQIANAYGIDPTALYSGVLDYRNSTQKSLPSTVQEYQYARENGQIPASTTLLEYQTLRSGATSAPKGKVLGLQEAVRLNLPELAGVATEELVETLISDAPANWFVEKLTKEYGFKGSLDPRFVKEKWDEFRSREEIRKFTRGESTKSDGSFGVFDEIEAIDAAVPAE